MADLHIGLKTYSKIDPTTHFSYRELEVLKNLSDITDNLINNHIPILAISGDIYHSTNVSSALQDEVNKIFFSAAMQGLKIIMIDGNHDVKILNTAVSPLQVFSTLNINNIIHSRFYREEIIDINNEKIRFVLLPTYVTSEEVHQLLDQVDKSLPIIVMGHFSVAGAKMNDWLVAENEEYVDLNAFKKDNIKFVFLGHLHKPQILNEKNPMVFYTGSLQRTDFNEENQDKGYWIIDTIDNSYQFIKINTLKFYTIKDSLKIHTLSDIITKIDKDKVDNAVVRIILEVDDEHKLSNDDEKYLNDYLIGLDASSISMKMQAEVAKRVRNEELKEGLSLEKSIMTFFKDKPREAERIQLAKDIVTSFRSQA